MHPVIEALRATLPPAFPRTSITKLTGELVAGGTVANLASQGKGPEGVFYVGKKACYEREAFLAWLEKRLSEKPHRNPRKPRKDS